MRIRGNGVEATTSGGGARWRGRWAVPARLWGALGLVLMLVVPLGAAAPVAAQSDDAWASPTTVYLPETGHTLDGGFLDLWREGGGAGVYGYPITPEIEQPNGHVVQYLQYARIEFWPEGNEQGNTYTLGKLGHELQPVTLHRTFSGVASGVTSGVASGATEGDGSGGAASGATEGDGSGGAAEALNVVRAWLPRAEADLPTDNEGARYVEATEHTVAGDFRDWWEINGEAGYLGNPLSEAYTLGGVAYQVFERGMLSQTEEDGIRLEPVGQLLADKYGLPQEPVAQGDIPTYSEELFVEPWPGYAPFRSGGGEILIDVDLSAQWMVVYQGDAVVLESSISSGGSDYETPTGTFWVHTKYETDDMDGYIRGEYYFREAVPDVLYFTDQGHAIHGAYWHNDFGTSRSAGCVNLPVDVADYLYSFTPVGTKIVIHY